MRFMSLWRPNGGPKQPDEALFKLIAEMTQSGALVMTGGWDPNGPCTILKSAGGKVTVTDGPFAESKEVIAGFAILEVKSREEAIMWTRRFMAITGDGVSEIREMGTPAPHA